MQECEGWRGAAPDLTLTKKSQVKHSKEKDIVHSVLAQSFNGNVTQCGMHRNYNNEKLKSGQVAYTLVYFPHAVGEDDGREKCPRTPAHQVFMPCRS